MTPAPETRTPVVPAPPFGHIAAPKDGASLDIPPPLPNGTQVHLRLSAHRAGPDDPAAPLLLPARQVAATVAAHTPAGQTILDTPHGRLALVLPSALGSPAVGDRMAIELVQIEPPPAISAEPVNALAAKNPAVVAEWETLRAILAALREINPELAQQVAARAVPQPGPELAHQLAAVLIAATGKAATLVGEAAVATLREAGRGALIDSLEKHGANLAKSPGPEASEWKILFLPLFERETFRQIRISTRNKRTDDKPDNRAGKRFVLETEFAGTGPIQIDGLLRASQLELIVRTHVEMPAGMQADIRAILVRNCGKSGIAGQISFQAMPVFPVSPFDEIGNSSVGCVV
ncbi:MAG: hypothetical protein HY057_02495 [Rhodospirillales bacterium]|nr:hypothetical protein [Rhodospirillales bacterium]